MSMRPICQFMNSRTSMAGYYCFIPVLSCAEASTNRRTLPPTGCARFILEEIARRFPKLTVIGAHCGNPEYEWAAEVARWNPNVFFDLSGSTLTKMSERLEEFKKIFWWSGQGEWKTATPANDESAFIKLVFGSDAGLDGIEHVVSQYRSLFKSCDVPASTQQMIMGGTLAGILRL